MRFLLTLTVLTALAATGEPPAQAASPVYVRDPLTDRLAQHPRTITFRDADLTRLHWSHWGAKRTTAHGRARVLVCTPSCAEGHRVSGSVRLTLRRRARVHGKQIYRCIEGRVRGVPADARRISWNCD